MQTFRQIQVGAREYSGFLKDEKQAHSQPFLTKNADILRLFFFLKKGNIPPPIMMISYSGPLEKPDSLVAVKSTYLGFQMRLVRLWMSTVKNDKADMAKFNQSSLS